MPKEKEYIKVIPKIYKRSFEDLGMFFFVEAQKKIVPTITACQAIKNYFVFIGMNDADYDYNSAIVTMSRMREEYIDLKYTIRNETAEKNCGPA